MGSIPKMGMSVFPKRRTAAVRPSGSCLGETALPASGPRPVRARCRFFLPLEGSLPQRGAGAGPPRP
eukprot:gene8675-biopygen3149